MEGDKLPYNAIVGAINQHAEVRPYDIDMYEVAVAGVFASCVAVLISAIALWLSYKLNKNQTKFLEEQNKIAMLEKRKELYKVFEELVQGVLLSKTFVENINKDLNVCDDKINIENSHELQLKHRKIVCIIMLTMQTQLLAQETEEGFPKETEITLFNVLREKTNKLSLIEQLFKLDNKDRQSLMIIISSLIIISSSLINEEFTNKEFTIDFAKEYKKMQKLVEDTRLRESLKNHLILL